MTGEPQAGGDADARTTLFDQDKAPVDAAPASGRRQTARSIGSTLSPIDTSIGTARPDETGAEQSNGTSPPQSPPGQPRTYPPSAHWSPSVEPGAALDSGPPSEAGTLPAQLTSTPDGSPASTGLKPPVPPPGAGLVETPLPGRSTAGVSPAAAGVSPAVAAPDGRRPLVRPIPGQGRTAPRPRRTEKRPSFRGTRRLTDRIGIWRRLLSFVELVIVVAVLGALVAAVIGAIVGAIVVALQKALNG